MAMGYLIVAVGGGIGAAARYALSVWVHGLLGAAFPWGTLLVNVIGSFVIGLVMVLSIDRGVISPEVRLLLTTGFCGGLTTFSTFSYETLVLVRSAEWALAGVNTAANVALCFVATALGIAAARWM